MICCSPFSTTSVLLVFTGFLIALMLQVDIHVVAPRPAVVPFLSMWAVSALFHPFSVCSEHNSAANLIPLPAVPKRVAFSKVISLEWGQFCSDKWQACCKISFPIYQTTCGFKPVLPNGSSWQKIVFPGLKYPVVNGFFFFCEPNRCRGGTTRLRERCLMLRKNGFMWIILGEGHSLANAEGQNCKSVH